MLGNGEIMSAKVSESAKKMSSEEKKSPPAYIYLEHYNEELHFPKLVLTLFIISNVFFFISVEKCVGESI